MPHSDDYRIWTDEIPALSQLLQFGGQPGKMYAYVGHSRELECNQNGWHRVANYNENGQRIDSGLFELVGPKGTAAFCIMETGDPIAGASPHGGARPAFIDPSLLAATGLTNGGGEPEPTVVAVTAPPKQAEAAPARVAR